ncbi:MAG: YncE family protein [Caulobacterales bacterium]
MNRTAALFAGALIGLALCAGSAAAQPAPGGSGLKVVTSIAPPPDSWDYASWDAARGRVYVAHGDEVMSIDAATGKVTPVLAQGSHLHAVVPIPGSEVLVTTNSGDNTARIINAADGSLVASLKVADDADSAIYDPVSKLVVVVSGDGGTVSLVDPAARTVVGTIKVGGSLEFPALDGKGKLFVNQENTGSIVVIDMSKRAVATTYVMKDCKSPTGLAYVSGDRLIAACRNNVAKIVDASTGNEIASLAIGGFPDAVIYDPTRNLAYIPCALDGTLQVISLSGPTNNTVIDKVATQIGARTGAVDPASGRVYLPTAEYILPVPAGQRPTTKLGTFRVLVLDRQ